ncbi:hypothetical protein JZ751_027815 [Albula glossodonta]|uniref:SAM domain-containing protein n=1 Tax=Albula glossodonta TaxID=121402 RepID=A0A8T2PIC2_9TELE|nr:hypothetical protein JZ751_027815 [Albula glossodonta]
MEQTPLVGGPQGLDPSDGETGVTGRGGADGGKKHGHSLRICHANPLPPANMLLDRNSTEITSLRSMGDWLENVRTLPCKDAFTGMSYNSCDTLAKTSAEDFKKVGVTIVGPPKKIASGFASTPDMTHPFQLYDQKPSPITDTMTSECRKANPPHSEIILLSQSPGIHNSDNLAAKATQGIKRAVQALRLNGQKALMY